MFQAQFPNVLQILGVFRHTKISDKDRENSRTLSTRTSAKGLMQTCVSPYTREVGKDNALVTPISLAKRSLQLLVGYHEIMLCIQDFVAFNCWSEK